MSEHTPSSGSRSKRITSVAVAAVVGIGLGLAGIYGIGGFDGNGAAATECRAALETGKKIDPLRSGEVAALMTARTPLSLKELKFNRADGSETTIGAFAGKTVLLNLWATWCAPCRKEMPALDRLQKARGGADFEVVAINIDTRDAEKPKRFLAEIGAANLAYYSDASFGVFNALKSKGRALGMPTTVLIDAKGCEIGTMNGPAEWDSPQAVALIEAAKRP
ncbi:MAG: TlpA family protein disulfide reductase [Hyphomicrobiaceae bacterium]|nr:TlpA family protein disulfide reductase [Hyphomicrobiaceae bacterium]